MKQVKKIIFAAVISSFAIAPVFADDNTQSIAFKNNWGNFYCEPSVIAKASDVIASGATINFDTKDIKVEGFCQGDYVTRPGHIAQLPVSELSDTYFTLKKESGESSGTLYYTFAGSGSVVCHEGTGNRSKQFRPGTGFC